MNTVRAVLLALLTLCGTMTGVTLAAGVTASSSAATPNTEQLQSTTTESEASNATLGSRISAFMQANAAETDGSIETGMWSVAFAQAGNKSTKRSLVSKRTNALQNHLDSIENRKQDLVEKRSAGEISELQYESRMSSLVGKYVALIEAINETERRAEATGADTAELEQLRGKSKRVAGQEIAAVAHDLNGVDAPGLEKQKGNGTRPAATTGNATGNGANGTAGKSPKQAGPNTDATDPANTSDVRGVDNSTKPAGATGNATGKAGNANGAVTGVSDSLDAGNVTAESTDAVDVTWSSGGELGSWRGPSGI